jgi:hypothetical protein
MWHGITIILKGVILRILFLVHAISALQGNSIKLSIGFLHRKLAYEAT